MRVRVKMKAESNSAAEFRNWIEAELEGIGGNSVPESLVYFRGNSTTIYIVDSEGEGRKQLRHGIPELDRSGIGGNW